MRRSILFLLCVLTVSLPSQTATDLDMGAKLEVDESTSPAVWKFRWWGKIGRHYLVHVSTDLVNWHYAVDYNPSGTDAALELSAVPEDDLATPQDESLLPWFFRAIEFDPTQALDPLHDVDGNRLNDLWEKYHWDALGASAIADPDSDGLTNLEEYYYGTNPLVADTDGDGMSDGWEVLNGLDPKSDADAGGDLDGDLISNLAEFNAKTNPRRAGGNTSSNTTGHDVVIVSPGGSYWGVTKSTGVIAPVSSL